MATKKKGQEGPETRDPRRPQRGPSGAHRLWYEEVVLQEARRLEPKITSRLRSGFPESSEIQLLAVARVAWSLGADPNALLLDAAVAALYARSEPRLSPAGRKVDLDRHFQDSRVDLIFRSLVAASKSASATRKMPEGTRREAIVKAMAREVVKVRKAHDEESPRPAAPGRDPHVGARKWLEMNPRVVRTLLARYRPGKNTGVSAEAHKELAAELMRLAGWDIRDRAEMATLRKLVAARSTGQRRRASAVRRVFAEIEAHSSE